MKSYAALLYLLCHQLVAHGAPLTGNELLRWHEGSRPTRDQAVLFYIRGIADSEEKYARMYAQHPPPKGSNLGEAIAIGVYFPAPFCVPDGVSYGQMYDVVVKHLADHPDVRHFDAETRARAALRAAWPCTSR